MLSSIAALPGYASPLVANGAVQARSSTTMMARKALPHWSIIGQSAATALAAWGRLGCVASSLGQHMELLSACVKLVHSTAFDRLGARRN